MGLPFLGCEDLDVLPVNPIQRTGSGHAFLPPLAQGCRSATFDDLGYQFPAAPDRFRERAIGPAFLILGAQLPDQAVALGTQVGGAPLGLGRLVVEFPGPGQP